jgi:hypothetical protein
MRASDNHAQSLARCEREIDVLTDHLLHAGRANRAVLNDQRTRGRLQRHRIGLGRQISEQFGQPLPALPRRDEAAPIGDCEIDRR